MDPATIAILCVILGCILGGGYKIGKKLGELGQSITNLSKRQDEANKDKKNLDTHIGNILDRLMRIETKLGIDKED